MIGVLGGWIICMTAITILGIVCLRGRRPELALGVMVAASFAVPVWLEIPIGGVLFNVQTFTAMLGMILLLLTAPSRIWSPLVLLDFIIASLVVLGTASDIYHGTPSVKSGLLTYGEWALPYIAGRYTARDSQTMEPLGFVICIILLVLGIGGLFESVMKINLWEIAFGLRPLDGTPHRMIRLGLRRAYGPTMHPIFLGLLILVLVPWAIAFLRWARNSLQQGLATSSMVAGSLGVLGTVSRAPALGLAGFYLVISLMWWKASRWGLVVLAILGIGWLIFDFNGVLMKFETLIGEKRQHTKHVLDGQELELSSAAQRMIMWQVYWPALKESGILGYGSRATSVLPADVPYLPQYEKTRYKLRYIDSAYLMFGLRYGWTGMVLFSVLLLAATWTGFRMAWDRSIGVLVGGLAVMTIALALNMLTVWFSYDMGFETLWSFGILAGLASQRR